MAKKTFESRTGRLITVNSQKWKYIVGRANVVAFSKKGEKQLEHIYNILGIKPSDWERACYKGCGSVTPKNIQEWLKQF